MRNTITMRDGSYCPCCGLQHAIIGWTDVRALEEQGFRREDMRVTRTTPNGLSIAHGGGYDWIDADVLGGNGSGTRSRQASHLGFNFEVVGRGRESLCRECSRWL